MSDILKEFSRKSVLEYARTRVPRQYLGPTLFPVKTVNELSFEYFKDENRLPVMANIQAFGAETQIASRDGASKVSGEIPPIKRKINLSERALIALKREGAGDADLVKNTIYNDIDNMVDSVYARIEKMRMDAVAYGALTVVENGIKMTVDYGVPAGNKQTLAGDDLWSDTTNATPVSDMQAWADAVVTACGVAPTRALTSNTVVSYLIQNAQVRKMVYGDNGASRAVSINQLNDLLTSLNLPVLATYDLQVRSQAESGAYASSRIFPSTRFIMLPGSSLGDTLMGPTAEALLDREVEARNAAGIYAVVSQEIDPPALWTKASATSIPTFPFADGVFQAVVLSEG